MNRTPKPPETGPPEMKPGEAARWLSDYRTKIERAQRGAARNETLLSWGRLISFGSILVPLVWLDTMASSAALAAALLLGVAFGFTVRFHRVARAKRTLLDHLLTVCDESQNRRHGRITLVRSLDPPAEAKPAALVPPFFDDGDVWSLTPQEIGDFDLHAPPVGLFGLLNRTSSILGARRLSGWLHHISLSTETLVARRQRVRYLAEHSQARMEMMASMVASRPWGASYDRLTAAIRGAVPVLPRGVHVILRIWSLVSLLATIEMTYLIGRGHYLWGYPLGALFFLNASIYGVLKLRLESAIAPWRETAGALRAWVIGLQSGASALPNEACLAPMGEALAAAGEARVAPKLMGSVGWAESGGMFRILCNLFFFFDLHVVCAILKRAVPYRDVLLRGTSALAELEALCSLASFSWEQPLRCFPEFIDKPILTIDGGCHPLIDPAVAVPNDVELGPKGRIWVLTGSNMSGKSTLLRMVGINVLLAQIGCAVVARRMTLSPFRIMTDLEAHDSLAGGESYFLAEVRHLRRMVLPPPGAAPILGLVDEPLRGTNSREQSAAGVAVLEHLRDAGHLFILATHDFHLNELADGKSVHAYHFREELDGDGMVFDYKLHAGPAQTRNALRVLKREGFPDSLLNRANEWFRDHDRGRGA